MKLSVLLVTYNHSDYIRQSLESILMQKVDFQYKIIVADDCSTDETVNIIKEYENNTNIPFIYLDSSRNLGITKNYKRSFNACDTEYVAVMEGDDVWSDPSKLQKHIDFLESHFECSMSFNRYVVAKYETAEFIVQPHWSPAGGFQYITARDLATDNLIGNFSTCVYRKSALASLPEDLFDMTVYDWMTNIMVAKTGLVAYLADVMSIYRVHPKGQWSGADQEKNIKSTMDGIDLYNKYTNYILNSEFCAHRARLETQLLSYKAVKAVEVVKRSRMIGFIVLLKDLTPPVFKVILKLLIPEKVLHKILK